MLMKQSISVLLCCLSLATPAMANVEPDAQIETLFQKDRELAQERAGGSEQQYCLKDFAKRVGDDSKLTVDGRFAFNELISRDVYRMLYWKGGERGVAFTMPVKMSDPVRGEVSTNVVCFYALKQEQLVFQYAQQLAWRL